MHLCSLGASHHVSPWCKGLMGDGTMESQQCDSINASCVGMVRALKKEEAL